MENSAFWAHIGEAFGESLGQKLRIEHTVATAGGSINRAYRLDTSAGRYFIKLNSTQYGDMFAAEAAGLSEILNSHSLKVPGVLLHGEFGEQAYIVLEFIEFGRGQAEPMLAEGLAKMHQYQQPQFGWHRNNTIGSTPQDNCKQEDWSVFWREQRLGYQLERVRQCHGPQLLLDLGARLMERLGELFSGYQPQPSLLHGDLWGGNHAVDETGKPVIFDPAVYYGDREADIAMTELFGGCGPTFYDAYNAAWPLDSGYAVRKTLYNQYHILNHYVMFGGGYGAQAEAMTRQLLAELE